MGIFYSYCKKCDVVIQIHNLTDSIDCPSCEEHNTGEDIRNSFYNKHFHKKKRAVELRRKKINDLLNGTN